jgi:hypothetical protein
VLYIYLTYRCITPVTSNEDTWPPSTVAFEVVRQGYRQDMLRIRYEVEHAAVAQLTNGKHGVTGMAEDPVGLDRRSLVARDSAGQRDKGVAEGVYRLLLPSVEAHFQSPSDFAQRAA